MNQSAFPRGMPLVLSVVYSLESATPAPLHGEEAWADAMRGPRINARMKNSARVIFYHYLHAPEG